MSIQVLLTPWPTYELSRTMLHFIFSQREWIWPIPSLHSPSRPLRPHANAVLADALHFSSSDCVPGDEPGGEPSGERAHETGGGPDGDDSLPSGDRPASGGPSALGQLLQRAERALTQSGQELAWLTKHPLWLPTPLAPLFKAPRWIAADC
jgi:hypothetical protein